MHDLAARAIEFEHNVEQYLVDGTGLLRSALDIRTMKPFPPDFFSAEKDTMHCPGADIGDDFSGLVENENSGMVSGAYLCAMVWKYQATRQVESLEKAYRTFYALKALYDRCQAVEPGYLCKPYGGRMTQETSSDQYHYVLAGLDCFFKIAGRTERDLIQAMVDRMTRYWIDRNYTRNYFGTPLKWPLNRFAGFAYLNHVYTGDEAMVQELHRLAALDEVAQTLPYANDTVDQLLAAYQRREKNYIEKKHGQMLVCGKAEHAESGAVAIAPCLDYNAPHRELWLWQLEQLYRRGVMTVGQDGMELWWGFYDPATRAYTPVDPPEDINNNQVPYCYGCRMFTFAGNIHCGMHSAMFARAALYVNDYIPGADKVQMARHILEELTHDKLRAFYDPDGQLDAAMQWHAEQYSGDAVAHWLWAYWQGRYRGLW